jgi:SAM-dependent methyltransferase
MEVLNRRSCPLCNNEIIKEEITCSDHLVSGEDFLLCRCLNCGFLFTQNAPTSDKIGPFYESEDYISHSDTKKGVMNLLYHYARGLNLKRKTSLVKKHTCKKKGVLLDIGTGTGYFLQAMQQQLWQVQAMEQSAVARQFAKEHFNLDVLPKNAWRELSSASFDAITLWHVMEHLHDLNETWEQLQRLLQPKGRLIVAVPNAAAWDAAYYGKDWAAYDVPRHLWHFSTDNMLLIARKYGFELEEIYPMPMDAFYISILSEQNRKNKQAFLKGMYVGFRAWCSSLLNKQKSSSLIFVFKKQQNG